MSRAFRRGFRGLLGGSGDGVPGAEIPRATVRDVAALQELSMAFQAEHNAAWGEGTLEHWARWHIKASVQSPEHAVFVARTGGVPIGFAASAIMPGGAGTSGKVEAVYVLPGQRGGGVASRLLEATLEALVARGATDLELVVSSENQVARTFFARFGFLEIDRVMGRALGGTTCSER